MKIIVLVGVPASGKSTWAKEYYSEHKKDTVIVNRDSIRFGRGEYWVPSQEDYIDRVEYSSVENALKLKYNVIIDATNLDPNVQDKWRSLALKVGAEIEFKEFYVPFSVAVERDENPDRVHHVGKKVIKKFYRKYYNDKLEDEMKQTISHNVYPIDMGYPPCVICDIDGTLAWMQNRSPYNFNEVKNDKVDERLALLLENFMWNGIHVVFLSGREGTDKCRQDTLEWIKEHLDYDAYHTVKMGGEYDKFELHMRKKGDYRPDEIIKKELFDEHVKGKYMPLCVFDDRDKVVDMWREMGLLCCQVERGDF